MDETQAIPMGRVKATSVRIPEVAYQSIALEAATSEESTQTLLAQAINDGLKLCEIRLENTGGLDALRKDIEGSDWVDDMAEEPVTIRLYASVRRRLEEMKRRLDADEEGDIRVSDVIRWCAMIGLGLA